MFQEEEIQSKIEELKTEFGKYKTIPDKYALPILAALSMYPELKEVTIHFLISSNSIFPYSSRPDWTTMLRNKEKWVYLIVIDEQSEKHTDLLLKNLPFNAQIAIIGHELAHTSYYLNKNFLQMIRIGLLYFLPSFREKFEKDTDIITLRHGLKQPMISYLNFLKTIAIFKNEYRYTQRYYLSEQEIINFKS